MNDDIDLGTAIFGDHRCFRCERPVADHEQHIHVPADDYIREELRGDRTFAELGLTATLTFCSDCIEESTTGYDAESHEIDVPDFVPNEWTK